MTASLENLQLEMGVSGYPLNYDYGLWGELATDSWVKSLWERVCRFKIDLDIKYKKLSPRGRTTSASWKDSSGKHCEASS